jgi:hypothetical protein
VRGRGGGAGVGIGDRKFRAESAEGAETVCLRRLVSPGSLRRNRVLPRSWLEAWRKRLCVLRVLCAKYSGSRPLVPVRRIRKAGGGVARTPGARTDTLRSHGQRSGYTDIGARRTDRRSRHTDIGACCTDTSSPRTDTRRGAGVSGWTGCSSGCRTGRSVRSPVRLRAIKDVLWPGRRVDHTDRRRRARIAAQAQRLGR